MTEHPWVAVENIVYTEAHDAVAFTRTPELAALIVENHNRRLEFVKDPTTVYLEVIDAWNKRVPEVAGGWCKGELEL